MLSKMIFYVNCYQREREKRVESGKKRTTHFENMNDVVSSRELFCHQIEVQRESFFDFSF